FPHTFLLLGQGYIGPAPVQLILFVSLALAVGIFLTRTVWGRYTYAVGYNETAARFSGIPVDKLKLALYALSGLLSGVAGVIFVARTGSARADAGLGYELDVIAAVLLGGASITGGEGTVIGTVLGVLLIALVRRSLTLLLVPTEGQVVVVGALLIASVALDQWLRQRRAMRWSETRTSNAD
ncbi:MAG TPA: ABC transporter permease, partial [Armatimonadetes bacterium]|nr:ABC transporter permease [Armatimonadota bacterium]